MVNFRRQIEETEQHLQTMMSHPTITPQHLMTAIRLVRKSIWSRGTNFANQVAKDL